MENTLEDTDADVLVILDCCHAGLLCRPAHRGTSRCFQYLVACPENGRTKTAGPGSFTSALTWALEQLSAEPGFHAPRLLDLIMKAPGFPKLQVPHLYSNRFEPCDEHIYISPMRDSGKEDASPLGKFRDEHDADNPPQAMLDLRCYFQPPLNSKVVENLALKLRDLMEKRQIHCSRIRLLDRDPKWAEWATKKWVDVWKRSKGEAARNAKGKDKVGRLNVPPQSSTEGPSSPATSIAGSAVTDERTSLLQNGSDGSAKTAASMKHGSTAWDDLASACYKFSQSFKGACSLAVRKVCILACCQTALIVLIRVRLYNRVAEDVRSVDKVSDRSLSKKELVVRVFDFRQNDGDIEIWMFSTSAVV